MENIDRIIAFKELRTLVPYSITHLYRLEMAGDFPVRVKLGNRRVGWFLSEVKAWMDERRKERQGSAGLTTELKRK